MSSIRRTVTEEVHEYLPNAELFAMLRDRFEIPYGAELIVKANGGGSYCGEEAEFEELGAKGLWVMWKTKRTEVEE